MINYFFYRGILHFKFTCNESHSLQGQDTAVEKDLANHSL